MPDPTDAQYATPAETVKTNLPPGAPKLHPAGPGPGLPFTGLDVGAMVVVAVVLTATGALLRRAIS